MVPPPQGCHRQRGRLTPTWALAKAQSGAVSRSIAMSCGQTPRPRHDGPLRTGGGLAQAKRRGGCRTGPHGPVRRPGNPPVLTMPPSRGAWRCKRGRGHSLAVRTKRNAGKRGAPKPCSRPLSDDRHAAAAAWVGSVRRHRALSQHLLRLRPSRVARQRIAHQHSATPRPPRGCAMRTRGAVDHVSRPRDPSRCPVGSGRARMPRSRPGAAFSGARRTFPLTGGAEAP